MSNEQQPNRYGLIVLIPGKTGNVWDRTTNSEMNGNEAIVRLNEQDREITALRARLEALTQAAEGALPFMTDALADETWYVCCGATEHTENCPLTIARADVTDQIAAARALLNSGKGVQGE